MVKIEKPPEIAKPEEPKPDFRHGVGRPKQKAVGGYLSTNDTKRDKHGAALIGGAKMRRRGIGKNFR